MFVEGVVRRQAGVISRGQAGAEGLSQSAITRRLRAGHWERVLPHVFLASSHELTHQAWARAVALWAGPRATVSSLAAAWWHDLLPSPPDVIEVTIPADRRLKPVPGVHTRRRDLSNLDRIQIKHLWITALPLTVLEAAVALGPDGPPLLDRALQRRVSFETVVRAHHRNLGRRGSAAASQLITAAADRAASQAERIMVKLLRDSGFRGWRLHHWTDGYELDAAFPEHKVAIEVDGWAWHWDADRFRADRRRQNALELAGWTVLRFTWHDLTQRPRDVVEEIERSLRPNRALTHRSRVITVE